MLPKEHGAWNLLFVSLAAGWMALGQWEASALALSAFWTLGFILRAPFSVYRQYLRADPERARRARGVFILEALGLAVALLVFVRIASRPAVFLTLAGAVPAGLALGLIFLLKRTLRWGPSEYLGFAALCLLIPGLYLCSPLSEFVKAERLYFLFAGYFLSTLSYLRMRRAWQGNWRKGIRLSLPQRLKNGFWPLGLHGLVLAGIFFFPAGGYGMVLAPLYALLRVLVGVLTGSPSLSFTVLGIREMAHSLVYMVLVMWFWK